MGDVQIQHGKGARVITKVERGRLLQLGGERNTLKTYLTFYLGICALLRNCLSPFFAQNSISNVRAITGH